MSTASTLQRDIHKRKNRIVLTWAAIIGLVVWLVYAFAGWQIVQKSQRYKQIAAGMTVDEVVALMGGTSRQSRAGEPVDPPMVTVPAGTTYEYAYTWLTLPSKFVYVLFDEDDRVVAVYMYDS